MLIVCTWLYGQKWSALHAERLFAGLRRNIDRPFRCALITDRVGVSGADIVVPIAPEDAELTRRPGCLVRMRLFDRALQERLGVERGDRLVNMDIDAVVTGNLDPLFEPDDEFAIMQGFNSSNPCPFNGSLWSFRAGERHDVWDDFSLEHFRARGAQVHSFPDDQGWLFHKFPAARAYDPDVGVYAFHKRTWEVHSDEHHTLPSNARFVAFPARRPDDFLHLDWVRKHWAGEC